MKIRNCHERTWGRPAVCISVTALASVVLLASLVYLPAAEVIKQVAPAEVPVGESASNAESGHDGRRIRQGTPLIKELGYFKMTGDRLSFHVKDSDRKYRGLENLALERIARTISDSPNPDKPIVWEVSGEFTEYQGGNYLLIRHALVKSVPEAETARFPPTNAR